MKQKISRIKRAAEKKKNSAHVASVGIHNLRSPRGANKKRKLLGRGPGSGHGKTSTRGSKGQTSRSGRHFYLGFEGGQTPLIRRIAKRGFTSRAKRQYQIINLIDLNNIKDPKVNPALLKEKGIIKDTQLPLKILGNGEIKHALAVQAHAFSRQAQEKIKKAGGSTELIVNV
ncbi:MAG: 50S ribosomal protein L15 [Candidatus Omnitrophota bacterium]|jgi:large subunit ribosomal protein L15|nr:MAG: 50S ribosomal protein L15 [Candidatus Omnitrophota bacterium]